MKISLLSVLAGTLCAIMAYTLFVFVPNYRNIDASTAAPQYHHIVVFNPHCPPPCNQASWCYYECGDYPWQPCCSVGAEEGGSCVYCD